jgi:hypothetical protein
MSITIQCSASLFVFLVFLSKTGKQNVNTQIRINQTKKRKEKEKWNRNVFFLFFIHHKVPT